MSDFDKPLSGYRFAEVLHGDTIQRLAARELGDARRWAELVALNNLSPPYLTDDQALASDRLIPAGGVLLVPAPVAFATAAANPREVFKADISMPSGKLLDDGFGDFAVISGRENLRQFLRHLIMTDKGEILFHGRYGCAVQRVIGTMNGPTAGLLAREYVRAACEADSRVREVARATHVVRGDVIDLLVEVVPIAGAPFSISGSLSINGLEIQ